MTPTARRGGGPRPPRTVLRWHANVNATVVYLAAGSARGLPLVENACGEDLLAPVRHVRQAIGQLEKPRAVAWNVLGTCAVEIDDPHVLAKETIRQLGESDTHAAGLGEALALLKQVIRQGYPNLTRELATRARPIQTAWDTYGPGLLVALRSCCPGWEEPENVVAAMVHPFFGGGGWALGIEDRLLFEAVLVDAILWLPEVVRLAWLVAQLGCRNLEAARTIPPGRFPLACQLAMIPPVLEAARELELYAPQPSAITQLLGLWHVPDLPGRPMAALLEHWWEGVVKTRACWNEALQRLDQLL